MLVIDRRIGSVELAEPLKRLRLEVVVSELPFGDVAFLGRGEQGTETYVGIELKTIGDLVSSLRTGRLEGHQLPGLQRTYEHRWLVVEGEWRTDARGQVQRRSRRGWVPIAGRMSSNELEKRLLTLECRGGLHVRHTPTRRATVLFLAALYRWWTDTALDEHKSHLVAYRPPSIIPLSDYREVVRGLPGIGVKTSKLMEEQFGTLYKTFVAGVDEFMQVEGIGRPTAERLVRLIRKGE